MYQYPSSHQQGFGQAYSGPPPAKKPKSNPVITYYPPPPGYQGPAQPQPQTSYPWLQPQPQPQPQPPYPWLQPQLQTQPKPPHPWLQPQPHESGGWAQPGHQSYPQHAYTTPQAHQQPQWSHQQLQAYVQNGLPSGHGYYPYSPAYPLLSDSWENPTCVLQSAPPQQWKAPLPPPPPAMTGNESRYSQAPLPHATKVYIGLKDWNAGMMPPPHPSTSGPDDPDEDFDYNHFARHPEDVDPNFSLGWLYWQAPLPTRVPLPATFDEAELLAEASIKAESHINPETYDEYSISDYCTKSRDLESRPNMLETSARDNDSLHKIFPAVCAEMLSKGELMERYRERPDRVERERSADAMEIDGHNSASTSIKREDSADEGDILSNLEQALHAADGSHDRQATVGSAHSGAASMSVTAGNRSTRPKPLASIRDHAQDQVLAALGVTGLPKTVFPNPGPALGKAFTPSSREDGSTAAIHRPGSGATDCWFLRPPPSSPPHTRRLPGLEYDRRRNGHSSERPRSSSSQHTSAGSDFQTEIADPDATPRPRSSRTNGRKRSHGETENDGSDTRRWRDNDEDKTPRQRSKHPRMDAAYE
ncbi:hypothetical protein LTR91_003522 [Friedmanniomyces endolithicus]|uniref:Uncharacterized protein n=1 Tax=Friedmanniomyces endolithicus TaxID=329885 RepID=A0AAN6QYR0_9PEZI|nr:hypothetical protein LTR94_001724 [Friedmanniomyces endolithicus]KAK0808007.1 hypothetical protein LTR59_003066 [Friedmanniomyces endolithicus]KAK0820794.1 hypothetical protein LTR75_001380 [Friedmanniomyces endolithicus]KAK0855885.1 hypothetical protein LTR03_001637 [Friedmanniomyces endolithicus]KAK0869642.1 hypothetical protein LTR87_013649 [Friedmanniomyces endolithicus]